MVTQLLMDTLLEVIIVIVATVHTGQIELSGIVYLLNVIRIDNQSSRRRAQHHVTVVEVDGSTAHILSVNTIAIVHADDSRRVFRIGKRQSLFSGNDDASFGISIDGIDEIGRQTILGSQLPALLRRGIIDIDATAVRTYPQLLVVMKIEGMHKTVHVFHLLAVIVCRSIGQLCGLTRYRMDKADTIGRADDDKSVGQLQHVFHIMYRIVSRTIGRQLHQIAVQTTHP